MRFVYAALALTRQPRSTLLRDVLTEARLRWATGFCDEAAELAGQVFLSEGRAVFGPKDRELLDATLLCTLPPDGFVTWAEYFVADLRGDSDLDLEVVRELIDIHAQTE